MEVDHGGGRVGGSGERGEATCAEVRDEGCPAGGGVSRSGPPRSLLSRTANRPLLLSTGPASTESPSPLPLRVLTCQATGIRRWGRGSTIAIRSLQTRFQIEEKPLHGTVAQRRPTSRS